MKRSYSEFLGLKRKTTSLIDEFEGFYGRDKDRKAIIDMLISDDDNGSNPGVIPIVGMGGVGKTTLAQHVYNDKAVAGEEQFKFRAWVCVSDQFDQTKVTKEIVEKVTRKACHYHDLDQLQVELKKTLSGEKFLLVLDDVWSEDYEEWRQLLTPLRGGAKGSKIIITTRSKKVASKVQTVPTHDLRELEEEDCWKLFARHACLDVNSTANRRELLEIGKDIVRKCGGLPLAARALGGVLRWETKVEKWKGVLKSEIWEVQDANILPALAMSYIHLPSHLKRCFAYCAMFPQDYELKKEELVALWMSEGFLVQRRGNQSLEEVGDMYFDDLVSRSFFQHSSDSWGKSCFVMHDLVHDLARFVSGEFCSRLERGTSSKIGERTRHLSYETIIDDTLGIHVTPFLRSLVCAKKWGRFNNKEFIDGLLQTRKLLRVLFLSGWGMRELSNSAGNLKHLRYLNLSGTSITLLPEAVTYLFNLEILILRYCDQLAELPAGMARLINLCQLDLSWTEKLKGMPLEIGKLKKLSKLSDFVVAENGGSSIKELGHLHNLRGKILFRGLQNVEDDRDASEVILKDKENLKVLALKWEDDSRQAKQVLERLQPHVHIESVKICRYGGREFPNWVGGTAFSKLKELRLFELRNCIRLPPLGQLASLEKLSIRGDPDPFYYNDDDDDDYNDDSYCDDDGYNELLEAIGPEFYGICKPGEKPFSSLKRLSFWRMKNWREWSSCNGAFPVLEELELHDCPVLMSFPNHLPSLQRLRIKDCPRVDFENLLISTGATLETIHIWEKPTISHRGEELEISYCYNLKSLGSTAAAATTTTKTSDPLFSPSLTSLRIERCSKLVYFPRGLHAPNLKSMKIEWCGNLRSLPQGMHSLLPSLEELELYHCPNLLSVPCHLPSLKRLRISGCGELLDIENLLISACATLEKILIRGNEKLKSISVETFPNLKELEICYCFNLESLSSTAAAAATTRSDPLFCPSLTSLVIEGCMVSFPRGGLHAPNLERMDLENCGNLESLPQGMHSLLPSLKSLKIHLCPEIESLPEEGLPSFLSSLDIYGCPLLRKRCERETGEDWPKIKYIPHLSITKAPTEYFD